MKDTNKKSYDVIVIGAGASGMMAAIVAAGKGARVLVLEHKDKIGKKILATGNGKCNFTNEDMSREHFRGDSSLVENVLSEFDQKDSLSFFENLGIFPKNRNGYFYPNSEQAASIVFALENQMQKSGVKVLLPVSVSDIKKKNKFCVSTDAGRFESDKLIIATGLLANPKLGSDGSIFDILKSLGHRFNPIVPALCGFYCKGMDFKKCAGVRAEGHVKALIDGVEAASDEGEIQFTDYGMSGIPVFQISRYISIALHNRQRCEIEFNLFGNMTEYDVFLLLKDRIDILKTCTLLDFFNGLINQKLAKAILTQSGLSYETDIMKLNECDIKKLTHALCCNRVVVEKSRGFEFAQVCAGGIRTEEIDSRTLESKIIKGLYFAGEILDVDGICGGYNLQWAWSSGFVVGNEV